MTGRTQRPAVHPLAKLVPEMTAEQFAELREGMVLDGRHRQRACEETGTQPRYVDFYLRLRRVS